MGRFDRPFHRIYCRAGGAAQINKALRQGTVMASVLAQFMAETTGEDVLDDGDTAKLVSLITMSVNSVARSALPVGTPSLGPQIVCPQRKLRIYAGANI